MSEILFPLETREPGSWRDRLFDKRVIDRRRKQGFVSNEGFDGYLKNLPDVARKSTHVRVEAERGHRAHGVG